MTPAADGDASPSRTFTLGLALIAFAAVAIRIAFVVIVDPKVPRIGDANAYHLLAENLAHGRGYVRPFDRQLLGLTRPTAEYPPLFPALLAIPAFLGAHSIESQRIFLAFVGGGTVVLIGLLGRRVATPGVGLVAAALAACSPMLFLSESILMAEALDAFLVTAMVLLAYRALDAPTVGRFVALGVLIGLATLTRAEGILLGILLVVPLCVRAASLSRWQRLGRAGAALGIALAVVVPWTARNAVRFHTLVPVSNNVATLVDGANCDATYRGSELGLWRGTFPDSSKPVNLAQARECFEGFMITDPHFDEAKVANRHRHDGLRYAQSHAAGLPKVMAVRVLRTWGLYSPGQQVNFESLEGRPPRWEWAGTILDWILLPLAVIGLVLLAQRRVPIWPLVATAVAATIVAALTYGQQRFRIAAEPAILVGAAVALVAAGLRLVDRRIPANAG
jgi:4-amino-4-deoxy-L-arabinose transferase-like glycosyltransferase